jgi:hypothetical protein
MGSTRLLCRLPDVGCHPAYREADGHLHSCEDGRVLTAVQKALSAATLKHVLDRKSYRQLTRGWERLVS